jgi:hypothetical protein
MDEQFEPLRDDEVLYVPIGRVLMSNPTFKVAEFLDALAQAVSDREGDWSEENEGWFTDGLECEALRLNSNGWQRGRVRVRVEFSPNQRRPKALEGRRIEKPSDPYADSYRSDRGDIRYGDVLRLPDDDY